jgi:hypothetical protein
MAETGRLDAGRTDRMPVTLPAGGPVQWAMGTIRSILFPDPGLTSPMAVLRESPGPP